MNAREQILKSIAQNQPSIEMLPEVDITTVIQYSDVCLQFKTVLESIGAQVIMIDNYQLLQTRLVNDKQNESFVINTVEELGDIDVPAAYSSAIRLEKLDRAYFKSSVAVAENGAVWLSEHQLLNRLLPFICQHLVLIVERKSIVATMHHAYEKINVADQGYGVFIAGPSKTADIEQSLVIGAHGARSATIYVVG